MIAFDRFVLDNGLKVLVHQDENTPMVAVNLLYNVGARDEDPSKTGFAHLFEHLMFGGSLHAPQFDLPLQKAGGENNAYTTNDLTNYYIQLPAENLETALWLESDRMQSLNIDPQSLEVQRKVVMEEFKEHYLNKPYGDAWFHVRELAYKQHPYRWMTIGRSLSHIAQASLDDVADFYKKYYHPANAILCIAGKIHPDQARRAVEKWFGDIPSGPIKSPSWPQEDPDREYEEKTVEADVPLDALYKTWHIGDRLSPSYIPADLITEILGNGYASRLYQALVKDEPWFSDIHCYHTGSLDPGLLVIEGKILAGKDPRQANAAIEAQIHKLMDEGISDQELQKVRNKVESAMTFENMALLSRAANLAYFELLGDAHGLNSEWEKYRQVSADQIRDNARSIFRPENSHCLYYLKTPSTSH